MTELRRRRSRLWEGLLLISLGFAVILPVTPAIVAREQSWLQKLREMFGYNPPLAPGGSRASRSTYNELRATMSILRALMHPVGSKSHLIEAELPQIFSGIGGASPSADGNTVCLVTPRLVNRRFPAAVVAFPNPTLFSQGPLAEWALYDSSGNKLKGALARSDKPIEGSITWPLPPLQAGQTLLLRLRPMEASGSESVEIALTAASAAEQAEASRLLGDPRDRLEVVRELLRQGKQSLALELVFAPLEAPSPDLLELRRILVATGCTSSS